MLQNRFLLGIASAVIVFFGMLFILQPTVAHAEALVQVRPSSNGDIAVFGGMTLTNGKPLSDVGIAVGQRDRNGNFELFDKTTTGSDGRFKLWILHTHRLHGSELTLVIYTADGARYQENILLQAGDIASVTIAMRTPLIPIFPFTVFVY